MAGYSASEIESMQQDAIRRVREMQRRSQSYVQHQQAPQPQQQQSPPPIPQSPQPPPRQTAPRQSQQNMNNQGNTNTYNHQENISPPPIHINNGEQQHKSGLGGILEGLLPDIKIDEERALIIFMLIILARNGAEMKLLAALGYLLM